MQTGSLVATIAYDGLGRRIKKAITNSGDWDCTYHYYYAGRQMIETRNGSSQVLKQYVWGTQYIDELVQIGINQDPQNADTQSYAENLCERFFYACQDANYNVLGVVNATGMLTERYEYTPYGQRTIYSHGWLLGDTDDNGTVDGLDQSRLSSDWGSSNPASRADFDGNGVVDGLDQSYLYSHWGEALPSDDALVTFARLESFRSPLAGGNTGVGLCDIGHQGLMHDKEFNLIYNRARYLHPILSRWLQQDPINYVDGMNLYQYVSTNPQSYVDPSGFLFPGGWQSYSDEDWELYWNAVDDSQIYRDLSWIAVGGRLGGLAVASRMMRNFLAEKDKHKKVVKLDKNWVLKSADAKAGVEWLRKAVKVGTLRFIGGLLLTGGWMGVGEYVADSLDPQRPNGLFPGKYIKTAKDDLDVWYAMGRFVIWDYPWVKAKCIKGKYWVGIKHRFRIRDKYDWHKGLAVHVPIGEHSIYIPDWVPQRLVDAGLARTFDVVIEWDEWETGRYNRVVLERLASEPFEPGVTPPPPEAPAPARGRGW